MRPKNQERLKRENKLTKPVLSELDLKQYYSFKSSFTFKKLSLFK